MVKEFGQFLEEVTKEFLELVEDFNIVEQDHLIEFRNKIKFKRFKKSSKITSPSDIDIIGIRGKELWIIECKESLESWDNETLNKKFKRAQNWLSSFSKRYDVKLGVACCEKHIDFRTNQYDKIFFLKEMIVSMDEKMLKYVGGSWLSYGRIEWLLKWMNYTKVLNPKSRILLDEKEYLKHFSNTSVWIFESSTK